MTQYKINHRNLPWIEPDHLISSWPAEAPLLYLGGDSQICYLATSFYEISFSEFCATRMSRLLHQKPADKEATSFCHGYWGLLNFEALSRSQTSKDLTCTPKMFRISQVLIFDKKLKTLHLSEFKPCPLGLRPVSDPFQTDPDVLHSLIRASTQKPPLESWPEIKLIPEQSNQHYLNLCHQILDDIRSGRYYQINLLRYFKTHRSLKRAELIALIRKNGGPFSALWDLPSACIASMSPEKFVDILPGPDQATVRTFPIKGTIHRSPSKEEDQRLRETLQNSQKDQAELHIIVDLMRNDLNQICQTGSVEVLDPGSPRSFKTVHHLVAHLSGLLKKDILWSDFFSRLCPGGSITGAPKKEVLNAIFEYEGRNRLYFMGNIFCLDDSGYMTSSILIRTLFAQKSSPILNEIFQYAAGSGITLKSNPDDELSETETKCKPVTNQR